MMCRYDCGGLTIQQPARVLLLLASFIIIHSTEMMISNAAFLHMSTSCTIITARTSSSSILLELGGGGTRGRGSLSSMKNNIIMTTTTSRLEAARTTMRTKLAGGDEEEEPSTTRTRSTTRSSSISNDIVVPPTNSINHTNTTHRNNGKQKADYNNIDGAFVSRRTMIRTAWCWSIDYEWLWKSRNLLFGQNDFIHIVKKNMWMTMVSIIIVTTTMMMATTTTTATSGRVVAVLSQMMTEDTRVSTSSSSSSSSLFPTMDTGVVTTSISSSTTGTTTTTTTGLSTSSTVVSRQEEQPRQLQQEEKQHRVVNQDYSNQRHRDWKGTKLSLQSLEEAVQTNENEWILGQWPDPILRRPAEPVSDDSILTLVRPFIEQDDDADQQVAVAALPLLTKAGLLLQQTAMKHNAVGLAAQQCGINARIIYMHIDDWNQFHVLQHHTSSSTSVSSTITQQPTIPLTYTSSLSLPSSKVLQLQPPWRKATTTITTGSSSDSKIHGQGLSGVVMVNPMIVQRSSEMEMKVWEEYCLVFPSWFIATLLRDAWVNVQYIDAFTGHLQYVQLTGELARIFQHEYDHDRGILITDHIGFEEMDIDMQTIEHPGHSERQQIAFDRSITTITK